MQSMFCLSDFEASSQGLLGRILQRIVFSVRICAFPFLQLRQSYRKEVDNREVFLLSFALTYCIV